MDGVDRRGFVLCRRWHQPHNAFHLFQCLATIHSNEADQCGTKEIALSRLVHSVTSESSSALSSKSSSVSSPSSDTYAADSARSSPSLTSCSFRDCIASMAFIAAA